MSGATPSLFPFLRRLRRDDPATKKEVDPATKKEAN